MPIARGSNLSTLMVLAFVSFLPMSAAENSEVIEKRIGDDLRKLASDELEGRGIETKGINAAADFVRDQFQKAGLTSGMPDGSYFQPFEFTVRAKMVPDKTSLVLNGPNGQTIKLELDKDFRPMSVGGSGKFAGPVVFAGYGISSAEAKYDDFAGFDPAGKVILVIRKQPQQGNKKSPFASIDQSKHATFNAKAEEAAAKKALAVLMINDHHSVTKPENDRLLSANIAGGQGSTGVPFIHIKQSVGDKLLEGSPLKSSAEAEKKIDEDLKPISTQLGEWTAVGEVKFEQTTLKLKNVVGTIEGEGPNANETIVIGAHYDHLGYGGMGSLSPNANNEIHNGADDNASGTSAILELARRFGSRAKKPTRRLVFIAFSAEEMGLIGSRHYVKKSPAFPLDKTIAMVNFDMVGRLRDNKVTLYGVKAAAEFPNLIDRLEKKHSLVLKKVGTGSGPSDNASFYENKIPAFHFFTDLHSDYHRPADDADKINYAGIRQVCDFGEQLIDELLAMNKAPTYTAAASEPRPSMDPGSGSGPSAYLGTIPDYANEKKGALLSGVTPDSPAAKGGLKANDLIIAFGNTPINDIAGLSIALRKHKPGETVEIEVERGSEKLKLKVTLGTRPERPADASGHGEPKDKKDETKKEGKKETPAPAKKE